MESIKVKCALFEAMIINSKHALNLMARFKNYPPLISYAIAELMAAIRDKGLTFANERQRLLEKHAERDDKGKPVFLPGGRSYKIADMTAYNQELDPLRAIEVDLGIPKVAIPFELLPEGLAPVEILELRGLFDIQKPQPPAPDPDPGVEKCGK